MFEVILLLINYLIDYVLRTKKKGRLVLLNKITGINELRTSTKYISCKFERSFDSKKATHIKNRLTITDNVRVKIQKDIFCAKRIILIILQHVVVKIVEMYNVLLIIQ